MKTTWTVLGLGVVLLLGSCRGTDPVTTKPVPTEAFDCLDDLRDTLTPDNIRLLPGETAQPTFRVFTCGGTRELAVTPRWGSADLDITTVDASSGLITAQRGGNTEITVTEDEYGAEAVVNVSVISVDPAP